MAELHGTLQNLHCQDCRKKYSSEEYVSQDYYCECGGVLCPSIILFGEMLPQKAFQFAFEESEKAELFIVMGSSLSETPANQFPLIGKDNGAKLVIINKKKQISIDLLILSLMTKRLSTLCKSLM